MSGIRWTAVAFGPLAAILIVAAWILPLAGESEHHCADSCAAAASVGCLCPCHHVTATSVSSPVLTHFGGTAEPRPASESSPRDLLLAADIFRPPTA